MTDLSIGDWDNPYVDVYPYQVGGATAAVFTIHSPTDTDPAGTIVPVDAGVETVVDGQTVLRFTVTAPVHYTTAGWWVRHWDITGVGAGSEDDPVFVVASPLAGGPTWAPGRSRVAAYVPHRTLARSVTSTVASADVYEFTFDPTTVPPGATVDRLIMDGVDWVTTLVTPMNAKSQPLAALVAAMWAGIAVERGWPDDDQALQRASDMEKQLNTMLEALKAANTGQNTTDGVQPVPPPVLPYWSFPYPDPRLDYPDYW